MEFDTEDPSLVNNNDNVILRWIKHSVPMETLFQGYTVPRRHCTGTTLLCDDRCWPYGIPGLSNMGGDGGDPPPPLRVYFGIVTCFYMVSCVDRESYINQ